MNAWQTIDSAPRDGTEILLTWMEDDQPQDIARMRWNPHATNFLFPGVVGMWDAMTFTWTEHNPDGAPTHWMPLPPPEDEAR